MKNKMILTIVLLLSCAITGLYAAAPGGAGDAEVYKPSKDAASNLEDLWLVHSLMPDALAQQLTKNWIKAGKNSRPSLEEVAQHFGGEGRLLTRALLEKVHNKLMMLAEMPIRVQPRSDITYQGDYRSFRDALIAYLNDALTKAGTDHGVALNISSSNLGELVRDNPGQFVDLMHEIHATIDRHRCILTSLVLSNNGLTMLPEGVLGQFDSLKELNLTNNQLALLPADVFAGLINLKKLVLSYNQLATLPVGIFADLINLQELSLANNQLVKLPAGIFAGLTNLQRLWLDGNQLAIVPASIFAGLTKLQQLFLSHNKFATLPVDIFAGLTNLQLFSLNDNQLTTLPAGIIAGLTKLKHISLFRNLLRPEVQEAIRQELPTTIDIWF